MLAYDRALAKRKVRNDVPFSMVSYAGAGGSDAVSRLMMVGHGRYLPHLNQRFRSTLVAPSTMSSLLGFITTAGNVTGLAQSFSDLYYKQDQTEMDALMSVGGAVVGLNALAEQAGVKRIPVLPALLGSMVSGYGLLQNFGNELGDLAFIMTASDGTDPQVLADAYKDIQDQGNAAWGNFIGTELSLAQLGVDLTEVGAAEPFAASVVQWMESNAGKLTLQSAGFIAKAYSCATANPPCYQNAMDNIQSAASEVTSLFGSVTQGFAKVMGDAQITYNNADPSLDPLSGIDISPFDSGQVSSVADPAGSFDMFIPLASPNTDYTSLSVNVFDPVTMSQLATEIVNLSSLTTCSPGQVPTLQGICNDTDSNNPDGDDPDCD